MDRSNSSHLITIAVLQLSGAPNHMEVNQEPGLTKARGMT